VPLDELPDRDWPDKAQLPNLSLVLNRAQVEHIARHSLEQQALSLLGYDIAVDDELPIARLRKTSQPADDASLWCLDPAHVRIDREMAYLAAPDELELSEAEAHQLIASLNQHFADDLQVHYHNPNQWVVSLDLQVSTRTPSEATLQDISRMMPVGEGATPWRSISNEIQMLLHHHPVNESRQQEGKLPVNSVWLWGGGTLTTHASDIDMVYTNVDDVTLAAQGNRLTAANLPQRIEAAQIANRNTLLVFTDQLAAIWQKDVYSWLADLQSLEDRVLSPLMAMLENGSLDQLVIHADGLRLSLKKQDLRKWWRRSASLQTRILSLRNADGD